MKKLLILPFILLCLFSEATHYYFSNAGNDGNLGTSPGASRKTIAKFNTMTFTHGDTISFNGGDIFNDAKMIVPSSGTGSGANSIVINSYGSGKAIISGWTSISSGSWASIGSNKYTVTVGSLSSLNVVTVDGFFQAISRYPKFPEYFNITSSAHVNGADQDTINSASTGTNNDSSFALCPTLTSPNAELCARLFHWVLSRGTVTGQTSTAIYYTQIGSWSGEQPQNTFGFFVQNDPALCTSFGDWAYNNSTHVLTMNFGSGGPTGHTIQAATRDTLIDINAKNWITIDNLSIQGANSLAVFGCGGTNFTLKNSSIFGAGINAVFGNCTPTSWSFLTDSIRMVNSIGLKQNSGTSSWTVTDCYIDSIGAVSGMGQSGESAQYSGMALKIQCDVERNVIKHVGYLPIFYDSINCTIQNNFIDSFGFIKDDAGGIYCDNRNMNGSIVNGNIVLHGWYPTLATQYSTYGTPSPTGNNGIYVDDSAYNVTIQNNTCAINSKSGIYCHNCHDVTITSNTTFDNQTAGIEYFNDASRTRNMVQKYNIFFAKTSTSPTELVYKNSNGSNATAFYATPATDLDSNFYARPVDSTNVFNNQGTSRNLAAWQTFISGDSHSKNAPKNGVAVSDIRFEYNPSAITLNVSAGGFKYIDATGATYSGTISVPAYSSLVLIKNGVLQGLFFKR